MKLAFYYKKIKNKYFIKQLFIFATAFILATLLINGLYSKSVKSQVFEATLMPPKVFMDLNRGQTYSRIFEIRNESDEKVTFYIQKSDLDAVENIGTPKFVDKVSGESYSLAKWMTFDVDELTLSKRQTGAVNVTISVPENAEPGGHYGAVWFSTIPPDTDNESAVAIGSNFVAQILTNVEGDIYRDVEVTKFETDKKIYSYLPVKFNINIKNLGNTHFEPVGRIRIKNKITNKEYNIQINTKNAVVLPKRSRDFEEIWIENPDEKEFLPKIGLYDVEYRLAGDLPFVTNNNVKRSVWVLPPKIVIGFFAIIIIIVLAFKLYGSMAVKRANKKNKRKK